MARVLASEAFRTGERSARFLKHIVDRLLEGRGVTLKEYSIGVEVFGRPESFDPRLDGIVRAEATRLRSRLAMYYAGNPSDGLLIDLPKGTYIPTVRRRSVAPDSGTSTQPIREASHRTLLYALGLAVVVLISGTLSILWRRSQPPVAPIFHRLTSAEGLTMDPSLRADGKFVVYVSDRASPGKLDVWIQPLESAGREVRLTDSPGNKSEPTFLADGDSVAYRSEVDGGIYVTSMLGGGATLLTHGQHPRFSPDGRFVYVWRAKAEGGNFAAGYVVQLSDRSERPFHSEFADVRDAVWSPDARYILFAGRRKPVDLIDWWVAPVDSGAAVQTHAAELLGSQNLRNFWIQNISWVGDRLYFGARSGDTLNCWTVQLRAPSWRIDRPPSQITSGPGMQRWPTAVRLPDGHVRVIVANTAFSGKIWMTDVRPGAVGALDPFPMLPGAGPEASTYISRDGSTMAYLDQSKGAPGVIHWRRLSDGTDRIVDSSADPKDGIVTNHNGSVIAYAAAHGDVTKIQAIAMNGGSLRDVCMNCGRPLDWGPDSETLIVTERNVPRGVRLLDINKGQSVPLLSNPKERILRARLSTDLRWVAFLAGRRIYIAPVRPGGANPEEWIPITDGKTQDDHPAWNADDNAVYFVSTRDGGHYCLWVQALDPATKFPRGAPVAVFHPHADRRFSANARLLAVTTGGNHLAFLGGSESANLWMADMDQH